MRGHTTNLPTDVALLLGTIRSAEAQEAWPGQVIVATTVWADSNHPCTAIWRDPGVLEQRSLGTSCTQTHGYYALTVV